LIEEHLIAAGDRQERKEKTDSDYAHQLRIALNRQPVAQAELFTNYIRKAETAKTSEGFIGWLSRIVLMLLFAIFVGKCFSSLPGSRTYKRLPPPMNFNATMPRFTPSPMSELQLRALVFHTPPDMLEVAITLETAVVVDVRMKNEYDAGHIQSAIWISPGELAARAKRFPKDKQIIFYGSEMEHAERTALELRSLGFTNVAVLEGSFQSWLDAGRPVTRPKASTRSRDRSVIIGTRDRQ
jgi:rhodanese-related sulfurtransferase